MHLNEPQTTPSALLHALAFAAEKHKGQTRKKNGAPYINHPIAVAEILARIAGVTDIVTLQAAFLHDTLEDTDTTPEELTERFGPMVLTIVRALTDDEKLPKQERKRRQIENAPCLSAAAKKVRIADKISNLLDLTLEQPADWSPQRKRDYLDWAEQVVNGCRGCNAELERHFDIVLRQRRVLLRQLTTAG